MAESLSDRARYLARHYHELQGLGMVPLALYMVAYMAWHRDLLTWLPRADGLDGRAYAVLGLGATAIVMFGIHDAYRRHYGKVKPLDPPWRRAAYLAKVFLMYFFLGLLSAWWGWRVDLGSLMIAGVMSYHAFFDGVRRPAYLASGILILIAVVLPVAWRGPAVRDVQNALMVLMLLVIGLSNHYWFVMTCDAIRRDAEDAEEHAQAV